MTVVPSAPRLSPFAQLVAESGWEVRYEVWGTTRWRADALLYRAGACVNVEFEASWPKARTIQERTYARLASGVWPFWLFDRGIPRGLEEAPFVTSMEGLCKILAGPVPYLEWLPPALTSTPPTSSRRNVACRVCGFPRIDPALGDHCWRCCFGRDLLKRSSQEPVGTWKRVPYSAKDTFEFHDAMAALPRDPQGVFAAVVQARQGLHGVFHGAMGDE